MTAAAPVERTRRIRLAIALSLAIFALNAWLCRELFTAEFINNLLSNEGAFASLGRFFRDHPTDYRWFPWFNVGMATENAYQPLLPVLAAVTGAISHWSPTRSLHAVLAFSYCCGPVTLFWLAWDWSESISLSLSAALAYTLTSPAEMLVKQVRFGSDEMWGPLRLNNLAWYGEAPHSVALTLLPLALLFLYRATVRGGAWNMVLAGVFSGAVALTNAFGAFGLALAAISMVLALERGLVRMAIIGVCSWCWVSPWLTPSLIAWIRKSAWSTGGFYTASAAARFAIPAIVVAFAVVWLLTRRLKASFPRFVCLTSIWMCAIPLGFFWLGLTVVPQSDRYQTELEMAICLLFGCGIHWLWSVRRQQRYLRIALVAGLVLIGIRQIDNFRKYAAGLLHPIDITKTIEYKVVTWIDHNLPGQRTLIGGDPEYILNVYSDNPQFSSGHDPTAPNWMQRVAVFQIQTGTAAGDRDAAISLFWLKAFGNQAIYVPGPRSREHYHAILNPHKFDGLLPVLWRDEDDIIFRVPQRSESMAHVIPRGAIVGRQPIHGLDIEPARPYVAALDDMSLPLADLKWISPSRATIRTSMEPTQVVSVQETFMPGWQAKVAGRAVPVTGDKLGLIVIDPACNGSCDIDLSFGVTTEGWICRALSAAATLLALSSLFLSRRRADIRPAHSGPPACA